MDDTLKSTTNRYSMCTSDLGEVADIIKGYTVGHPNKHHSEKQKQQTHQTTPSQQGTSPTGQRRTRCFDASMHSKLNSQKRKVIASRRTLTPKRFPIPSVPMTSSSPRDCSLKRALTEESTDKPQPMRTRLQQQIYLSFLSIPKNSIPRHQLRKNKRSAHSINDRQKSRRMRGFRTVYDETSEFSLGRPQLLMMG